MEPNVLLADPLDDIAARYVGRAAQVEVVNAPDVFAAHARFQLNVLLEARDAAPADLGE